jgi:hypothetical protein
VLRHGDISGIQRNGNGNGCRWKPLPSSAAKIVTDNNNLCDSAVMRCVIKCPINPIINSGHAYQHLSHYNIYLITEERSDRICGVVVELLAID